MPTSAASGSSSPASEPALPPRPSLPPSRPPAKLDYQPPATVEAAQAEADEVAHQLMRDFPNNSDALGLMGMVHDRNGDADEAEKWWQACLRRNPKRADAYNGLAWIAKKKGDAAKAVELWRKALQIDSALSGVNGRLGQALIDLGRTEEALAPLTKEAQISPKSSECRFLLGQAYLRLKQYEKAKENYLAATEIRPDHANAYYGLATVFARQGQKERSQEYREKHQKIKTESLAALRDRRKKFVDLVSVCKSLAKTYTDAARVYRGHRHLAKAEQLWRTAALLDPKDQTCRRQLASLYEQTDRARESLRICTELRQMDPKNAFYHMNVGVLNARLGRFGFAVADMQKALELEPDNAAFRRLYELIRKRR